MQSLHSAIRGPFSPFMETDLKGISSGMHHIVSSPVRIASVGNHSNQSGPAEVTHSMGQQNLCSPSFHPNSLPEFHNGHAGSLPYINSRPGDGIENIHFMRVDSSSVNSHGFEHNEGKCNEKRSHLILTVLLETTYPCSEENDEFLLICLVSNLNPGYCLIISILKIFFMLYHFIYKRGL